MRLWAQFGKPELLLLLDPGQAGLSQHRTGAEDGLSSAGTALPLPGEVNLKCRSEMLLRVMFSLGVNSRQSSSLAGGLVPFLQASVAAGTSQRLFWVERCVFGQGLRADAAQLASCSLSPMRSPALSHSTSTSAENAGNQCVKPPRSCWHPHYKQLL